MTNNTPTFADFVAKFPPVTVPITIGEGSHHSFGVENEPLSEAMITQFIHPALGTDMDDEYTEYVPCFAIDNTQGFIALVWWKAELLNYEYTLATFTAKGQLIDKKVIAYTRVGDGKIARGVVTINEEWELIIGEGVSSDGNQLFDPTTSSTRFLEIMANGEIA